MGFRTFLSSLLFALVALLSFAIWAIGSDWYRSEARLYAFCALVFLAGGGLALVPVSGLSGRRAAAFCLRFAIGFSLYALAWSVAWFTFRDTFGEIVGSFAGLLALTAVLPHGPAGSRHLLAATATVFLWHTLGYYTGGFAYQALQNQGALAIELPLEKSTVTTTARFAWGLFYGLGFGYGLARLLRRD